VEISMEDASTLEVLAPGEDSTDIDVEDSFDAASDLGEIEETPVSAPPPVPEAWDMGALEPARPSAKEESKAEEEELDIEPMEELEEEEEEPVSLSEEAPAEAKAEPVEEMSEDVPEMSVEEVSGEELPEPVQALEEEAPELMVEEVSAEALPAPVEVASAEPPELTVEEVAAEELPEPVEAEAAPLVIMPREEVVAEAQVAKVGETVVENPRPPIDLGELPPVPEEPMELAANWEFMSMAEAQATPSAEGSEERGIELDTTAAPELDYSGDPQEEVALAPAWDFVPQWQPQDPPKPAAPPEPPAPPAPPVLAVPEPLPELSPEPEPLAPIPSPAAGAEFTTTGKYGTASFQPAATGKYGIASSKPGAADELGLDEPVEKTGLFGVVKQEPPAPKLPERSATGKFGAVPRPPRAFPTVPQKAGQESSWDQLILAPEPEQPPAEAPAEPDPFAEFAAGADSGRPSKPGSSGSQE
jgi:hypothetical protein